MKKLVLFSFLGGLLSLGFVQLNGLRAGSTCTVGGNQDNNAMMFKDDTSCTCGGYGSECIFMPDEKITD